MQIIWLLVLVGSQFVMALSSQPATTQPSRGGRAQPAVARPNYEPVVFRLKYANGFEVSRVLANAFAGCGSIPVEQTNSIVFSGPPEIRAMAAKLIEELDIVTTQSERSHVVVESVKHRRVEELVDHLSRVFIGPGLRVSGDHGRSKILLRGDPEEIKRAEVMVQQLDSPATAVSIEFAFIQAKAGGAADGPPMPPDLADVAKELERFGQLTLLGRLSSVAVEGEKFGIDGNIHSGIKSEVRGLVTRVSPEGAVKAEIRAALSGQRAIENGSVFSQYFTLETSVSTQRGEYLVLGSAPGGFEVGESAILVMHVRK